MKSYYRIMLGRQSRYFDKCLKGNFIGVDFEINADLTDILSIDWREFNQKFIPIYMQNHPDKSKITAGLACGSVWTVSKGIQNSDVILCPNGLGKYLIGEVSGQYSYKPGDILPHRRDVRWYPTIIERTNMSQALQYSTGSIGTVCNITRFADEIERLFSGNAPPTIFSTDETVEDPSTFALEEHLEEFLVQNWKQTEFGKNYSIYEEEGELVGQQYASDTGLIDILAISKDKKEILIIELKRGRASDNVIGQIQRYMGYVQQELAESGQSVKGVIIAHEDDIKIRRALVVAKNIEFYRYQVSFKLFKS